MSTPSKARFQPKKEPKPTNAPRKQGLTGEQGSRPQGSHEGRLEGRQLGAAPPFLAAPVLVPPAPGGGVAAEGGLESLLILGQVQLQLLDSPRVSGRLWGCLVLCRSGLSTAGDRACRAPTICHMRLRLHCTTALPA